MVMACADVCFNMIAFQDEMKAKKKGRRSRTSRKRYNQCLAKHKTELASSSPSEPPTVPASLAEFLLTELAEKIAEGALEGRWEWERKIPAGGARGPRAGENSHNQLV